jgi:transposase-like protein
VKKKTVSYGGIFMSQKGKLTEENIHIIRECADGKISCAEAAERCGVVFETMRRWASRYRAEGAAALLPTRGNCVYSPERKEAAVKAYLSGEGSMQKICEKYKIRSDQQLRTWIKVYNGHKDFKKQIGGSRMTKGRETTQAERIAIAKACVANGKNYGEVAIQYNVSYQQARSWTLKYIEGGENALEDRRGQRKKDQQPRTELEQAQIEIEQLKHKLKMLEMENRLLKKLEEIERRRG